MRLLAIATLAAGCAGSPVALGADPLPERAAAVADYDISVTLDPPAKSLAGHARITWRNPSTDTVGDLWFHLYLNAFRNTQSTFWQESGGRLRDLEMPEDGWGWIDITSLALADGTDLTAALRFAAPDDGNPHDRTVARVVLPRPVLPGASVELDVRFTARLPRAFARTGYVRDYFLIGQWFPKLGVYEPAGRRGRAIGGWNCHQYHADSEFYADFGHYRVAMTVPAGFVVGATGRRVSTTAGANGMTTFVHQQDDVHDFAWVAQPGLLERRRRFVAAREVTEAEYRRVAALLDRPIEEVRLTDVDVILLLQPQHEVQAERHFRAAMLALEEFGLHYGRYPYPTLTIVDPAFGAPGSGGMEYPTFITAGTSALQNRWPFDRLRLPEVVTIHEIGHQFWQGLVANNEFEEAWLDEGITSYVSGRLFDHVYPSVADVAGLTLRDLDVARLVNTPERTFDAIRQPAWTFAPGQYGFSAYMKPQLALLTLEAQLGEQTMARVMRTFHERWRFRHPSSDDFYAVVNEVSGRDLRPLLLQLFESAGLLDYEVTEVKSDPIAEPSGYLDGPGGPRLVKARDDEDEPGVAGYASTVVVRRRGSVMLPVQVVVAFTDGHVETLAWDGVERWRRFTFTRKHRIAYADIDPGRRLVLDVDWLNNSRRLDPDRRPAASLAVRWMVVVQQLVSWLGL